jgi:hypothetical protein
MTQLVSPGSSFSPTWGDNFSDNPGNKLFALYQGTTLVVPLSDQNGPALAPATVESARNSVEKRRG